MDNSVLQRTFKLLADLESILEILSEGQLR